MMPTTSDSVKVARVSPAGIAGVAALPPAASPPLAFAPAAFVSPLGGSAGAGVRSAGRSGEGAHDVAKSAKAARQTLRGAFLPVMEDLLRHEEVARCMHAARVAEGPRVPCSAARSAVASSLSETD